MTIEAYLDELQRQLAPLDEDEQADVLDFYLEYIEDAKLTTDAEVIAKLGTPRQLARKILADHSIKQNEINSESGRQVTPKSNISMIWVIILAILSTPVTIPISIIILLVLFAFVITAVIIIGSILATLAALIISGIVLSAFCFYIGLGLILTHFFVGLSYMGLGLVGVGIVFILIPFIRLMAKVLFQAMGNFFRYIYTKFNDRRNRRQGVA